MGKSRCSYTVFLSNRNFSFGGALCFTICDQYPTPPSRPEHKTSAICWSVISIFTSTKHPFCFPGALDCAPYRYVNRLLSVLQASSLNRFIRRLVEFDLGLHKPLTTKFGIVAFPAIVQVIKNMHLFDQFNSTIIPHAMVVL